MRLMNTHYFIILLTLVTSQQASVSAASQQTQKPHQQAVTIPSETNENNRAKRATAIARVKYIRLQGGSKYTWEIVQILETLKNTSKQKLEGEVSIAHYFQKPGIPTGESTVYLVPYSDRPNSGWKLLSE